MASAMQNLNMEVVNVDDTEEPLRTLNTLYEMQQDQKLTDVVLIAKENGIKIPVHRNILSARCVFFRGMFSSKMSESMQTEIHLSEVSGEDLTNIIKYIYTGNIELSEANIETLMAAAHYYQLADVVSVCGKFLQRKLDFSNCLGFWAVAELHDCTSLMATAQKYACNYFEDVCKSEEFLKLDDKRLRIILASDDLCVRSEEIIFESIIVWLQHEKVERKKYIRELLPYVRVDALLPTFIRDQRQLILKTMNDPELLGEIMTWYLSEQSFGETLLAVMTNNRVGNIPIYKYIPDSDEWKFWNTIETNRIDFGVATMDGNLIVAGGLGETSEAVNIVTSVNTKTMSLKTLNPMGTCRQNVSLVVLGDFLYAIGGQDNGRSLKSVERWNRRTGLWTDVAPMRQGRYGQTATVLNGYIYVAGGGASSTECYNPRTQSWTTRAPVRVNRTFSGVAVLNNYLYVVGGPDKRSMERYDSYTNTWRVVPCPFDSQSTQPLQCPRLRHVCIELNNSLIVVGSLHDIIASSTVEEYDAIANVWTKKCPLPVTGHCILVKIANSS